MDQGSTPPPPTGTPPAGTAPNPHKRASVEAEASMMNRGRGRQLIMLGLGAALVLAAGGWMIRNMGISDAYAQASADTAAIEREHLDGFFSCAFRDRRPPELDAHRVRIAFERMGNRLGKADASKTLQACQPRMEALGASVQALQVPPSAQPSHAELVTAASALMAANQQYLRYLSTPEPDYDAGQAQPSLEAFGHASAGYLAATRSLQAVLERRL